MLADKGVARALVGVLALLTLYPLLTRVVLAIEDAFIAPGQFEVDATVLRVLGNTAIDVLGSAAGPLVVRMAQRAH